jgi:hypothetical protein
MAFWDNERSKLGGFGAVPLRPANMSILVWNKMTPAQKIAAVKPKPVITSFLAPSAITPSAQGPDPHAIAATIPEDVKKPVDVVLPPPSGEKTKQILAVTGQTLQNIKAQIAQAKQGMAQVKTVTSKLKGFFGFGAADISLVQKTQVTQQGKQIADKALSDSKQALDQANKTKAVIAQHKADLMKDKAQIANERAKVKEGIAKKQKNTAYIKGEQAKIPAMVSK